MPSHFFGRVILRGVLLDSYGFCTAGLGKNVQKIAAQQNFLQSQNFGFLGVKFPKNKKKYSFNM